MQVFKKNDVVELQGKVRHGVYEGYVTIDIRGNMLSLPIEDVTLVTPHLDPGDPISCGNLPGKVVATNNGWAWVEVQGSQRVVSIADLDRRQVTEGQEDV